MTRPGFDKKWSVRRHRSVNVIWKGKSFQWIFWNSIFGQFRIKHLFVSVSFFLCASMLHIVFCCSTTARTKFYNFVVKLIFVRLNCPFPSKLLPAIFGVQKRSLFWKCNFHCFGAHYSQSMQSGPCLSCVILAITSVDQVHLVHFGERFSEN